MDTLTPGLSVTFKQLTLWDIDNATSSPESVDGHSLCDLPESRTTKTSGREVAHVSHSVSQVGKKAKRTKDISGQCSAISFDSTTLNGRLANRFLRLLGSGGSMEYRQTWKTRETPLGISYVEHTASARRTSDSDCSGELGGYPTPVAQPANGTPEDFLRRKRESVARGSLMGITLSDLNMVAQTFTGYPTPKTSEHQKTFGRGESNPTLFGTVAGYSTPTVTDHSRGGLPPRSTDTGIPLTQQVAGYNTPRATDGTHGGPNQSGGALPADVAGYVTPSTRDFKDTPGMSTTGTNPDGSERTRNDQLPRQIHGLITPSDTTETARPGVLDAAFSRWLMGFPEAWDEASPNYDSWRSVQEEIAQGDSKDMGTQ